MLTLGDRATRVYGRQVAVPVLTVWATGSIQRFTTGKIHLAGDEPGPISGGGRPTQKIMVAKKGDCERTKRQK